MIALDTNVLVRFLTQDDPEQSELANGFVERLSPQQPGYISAVVILETYWVLRRAYRFGKREVLDALSDVCSVDEFSVEHSSLVERSIHHAIAGADFADALIFESARRADCHDLVTFDRKAARRLGVTLLQHPRHKSSGT